MWAERGTFTGPNEFAAMLHPWKVELTPLGCGQAAADLAAIEFRKTRLRRMSTSLQRPAHVQHLPDRTDFSFLADEASAPVIVDGMRVAAGAVLQVGSVPNSNQYSLGPTRWASISVDRAGLAAMRQNIAEQDLAACGGSRVVIPGNCAMHRLRRLHAEAIALATQAPTSLAGPQAPRGMENQLMDALAHCLAAPVKRRPTSVQSRHAALTERFRDLLEDGLDGTLHLPEVCAALGVSHRTLSNCCHEILGMAPKRYFYLHRMCGVRRALRQAEQHATTVTEIATYHGFWEFGRFSVQYKALFGETPSATLRRESSHVAR